jgi:hypothetical protein
MPKQVTRGRRSALGRGLRGVIVSALAVLVVGCDERERLIFPAAPQDVGPITTIDHPGAADTTVEAGPDFVVSGLTTDPQGVDTVYFFVIGGNQPSPYQASPPVDTVFWGVPVSTTGRAGQTLTVEVYGVDSEGHQGAHASRAIRVR